MTSTYDRGRAAGAAEAAEREYIGDADSLEDGPIWFARPASELHTDGDEYERGWLTGWADHFEGRGRP